MRIVIWLLQLLFFSLMTTMTIVGAVEYETQSPVEEPEVKFYSRWIEMFGPIQWEIWGHRILATIAIVVLWELFLQPKQQQQDEQMSTTQHQEEKTRELVSRQDGNITDSHKDNSEQPEDIKKEKMQHYVSETTKRNEASLTLTADEKGKSDLNIASPISGDTASLRQKAGRKSTTSGPATAPIPCQPPRIRAKSGMHPGMAGFAHWYDVETSLYRIYTLTRKDGEQVVPPYIPHSYRGNVSVFLHVTNSTRHVINVYWVDYKGAHILKGTIKPNHVWTQSTWIDHRKC